MEECSRSWFYCSYGICMFSVTRNHPLLSEYSGCFPTTGTSTSSQASTTRETQDSTGRSRASRNGKHGLHHPQRLAYSKGTQVPVTGNDQMLPFFFFFVVGLEKKGHLTDHLPVTGKLLRTHRSSPLYESHSLYRGGTRILL